jgi:hypothetical protein
MPNADYSPVFSTFDEISHEQFGLKKKPYHQDKDHAYHDETRQAEHLRDQYESRSQAWSEYPHVVRHLMAQSSHRGGNDIP